MATISELASEIRQAAIIDDITALDTAQSQLESRMRDSPGGINELEMEKTLDTLIVTGNYKQLQQIRKVMVTAGIDGQKFVAQEAQAYVQQGQLEKAVDVISTFQQQHPQPDARLQSIAGDAFTKKYLLEESPLAKNSLAEQAMENYQLGYNAGAKPDLAIGARMMSMQRRIEQDNVNTQQGFKAERIAEELLTTVKQQNALSPSSTAQAFSIAAQSNIVLGRWREANTATGKFLKSSDVDTKSIDELVNNLRTWGRNIDDDKTGGILSVAQAEKIRKTGGTIDLPLDNFRLMAQKVAQSGVHILGEFDGFRSAGFLVSLIERGNSIARIQPKPPLEADRGGTGFIIDGGLVHASLKNQLLILTNEHVVTNHRSESGGPNKNALLADEAVAELTSLWCKGEDTRSYDLEFIWSSPAVELDATLLRPARSMTDNAGLPLTKYLPVLDLQDPQRIYVVGFPGGDDMRFSIQSNVLVCHDGPSGKVYYTTPTKKGNSGGPVFNANLDVIGLHHYGMKDITASCQSAITDVISSAGEGIWIQSVLTAARKSISESGSPAVS